MGVKSFLKPTEWTILVLIILGVIYHMILWGSIGAYYGVNFFGLLRSYCSVIGDVYICYFTIFGLYYGIALVFIYLIGCYVSHRKNRKTPNTMTTPVIEK